MQLQLLSEYTQVLCGPQSPFIYMADLNLAVFHRAISYQACRLAIQMRQNRRFNLIQISLFHFYLRPKLAMTFQYIIHRLSLNKWISSCLRQEVALHLLHHPLLLNHVIDQS